MHDFKQLELEDRGIFAEFLGADPPQASEYTFTNFYMWRHHFKPLWAQEHGCLVVILSPGGEEPFGLKPIGAGDKGAALDVLFRELDELSKDPRIARVEKAFVETSVDIQRYRVEEDRANSDYVYRAQDLINLSGNRYHSKKNHVNRFVKNNEFEYKELDEESVECCLDLQEEWCELRSCTLNPGLEHEDRAIYEALINFQELAFQGGVIKMNNTVQAFGLGERLNEDTAVIHIEKANPNVPGLYAAINKLFCQEAWSDFTYINREQDLGEEGLRKAKSSYHPDHMIDKFVIRRR